MSAAEWWSVVVFNGNRAVFRYNFHVEFAEAELHSGVAARDFNLPRWHRRHQHLHVHQSLHIVLAEGRVPHCHNRRYKVPTDVICAADSNTGCQRNPAADDLSDLMHGNGNWAGLGSTVGDTQAIAADAEGEFGRMTFFDPALAWEATAVTEPVA